MHEPPLADCYLGFCLSQCQLYPRSKLATVKLFCIQIINKVELTTTYVIDLEIIEVHLWYSVVPVNELSWTSWSSKSQFGPVPTGEEPGAFTLTCKPRLLPINRAIFQVGRKYIELWFDCKCFYWIAAPCDLWIFRCWKVLLPFAARFPEMGPFAPRRNAEVEPPLAQPTASPRQGLRVSRYI